MADRATIVEREEVRVLFRRTAGEQEAISRTWAEVEAAVGSLRGRKFYGTFDPESNEYSGLCAVAGRRRRRCPRARRRDSRGRQVRGERLAERPDLDPSRPSIEFYRRHDVIDLLLPVT